MEPFLILLSILGGIASLMAIVEFVWKPVRRYVLRRVDPTPATRSDIEQVKESLSQLQDLLTAGSATRTPTEDLANAAGADTLERLHEALRLHHSHKEREAIDVLYEAFRRDLEPEARAELHNLLGTAFLRLSHSAEAEGHLQQALETAKQSGLVEQQAIALNNLGVLRGQMGKMSEAKQLLTTALEIGGTADRDRGTTLGSLGVVEYHRGNYKQARNLYEEALDAQRRKPNRRGEADTLGNLGNLALAEGKKQEALRNYAEAIKIFAEIGDRIGYATAVQNLGNLHRQLGDLTKAKQCYQQALEECDAIEDLAGATRALTGLGNVSLLENNTAEAMDYYRRALANHEITRDENARIVTLANLATCHKNLGQTKDAKRLLSEALAISERTEDKMSEALVLTNLALLVEAEGKKAQSCRLFLRAWRIYERLGAGGEGPSVVRAKLKELGCEEPGAAGSA